MAVPVVERTQIENSVVPPSGTEFFDATAHHLEWFAYAPPRFRPAQSVVKTAVRALLLALDEVNDVTITFSYGIFSRLGSAFGSEADDANTTLRTNLIRKPLSYWKAKYEGGKKGKG